MIPQLTRIRIAGFRSLRKVDLALGPLTVLIGPNGAGKSNVLSALEMVRMLTYRSLQKFVSERGGASYLMHYGPKETPAIDLTLEFATDGGKNIYEARLGYGADESLLFLSENAGFWGPTDTGWRRIGGLGVGHRESALEQKKDSHKTAETVYWLLRRINFYHFHDTSLLSPLRTRDFANESGDYLRSIGSNLAAFLEGIQSSDRPDDKAAWLRIEGTIRRIAPFISKLVPVRDRHGATLGWIDDRGASLGPSHLSDGTLRALALVAALGQPESGMPLVSSIDEPELGLHPAALEIVCGLISSVVTRRQVILSTQSPVILDHFEPEQVVVAERYEGATTLKRLEPASLVTWLEDYSLSELYDKNVLGGRP